jgi:hypothetical protein
MSPRLLVPMCKVVLLVLGIMALSAVPVQAEDGKNYPGSMCVRFAGPAPFYHNSGIGNPGSTDLLVDCPAIKDATNIRSGWVRVVDRNPNADVRCELRSLIRAGSTWDGCGTGFVSSAGNPVTTLHLSFPGLSCSTPLHHYFYSCRIPPAVNGSISYITSYQVNEND